MKKTKSLKKINWALITKLAIGLLLFITIILVILMLVKGKSINNNSSLVNNIYGYLGNNDLSYCNGLFTYGDKEVNYENLDNTSRLCNSYASLYTNEETTVVKIDKTQKDNKCSVSDAELIFATDNYEDDICTLNRVDKETLNNKYRAMYGKDIEEYDTFNLSSTIVCQSDEEYYYCGLAESYTLTIGAEPETFRSIKNAYEKGSNIVIYDYFIRVVNDECYTSFTGDTKNSSCTTEYETNKEIDYKYLKKYGTLYKHTFKKESKDNYYWISSEPV